MLIQKATLEEVSDALEASQLRDSVDLGGTVVHSAIHSTLGPVFVIATCGDQHAIIRISHPN